MLEGAVQNFREDAVFSSFSSLATTLGTILKYCMLILAMTVPVSNSLANVGAFLPYIHYISLGPYFGNKEEL